jgi:hypothetical protein
MKNSVKRAAGGLVVIFAVAFVGLGAYLYGAPLYLQRSAVFSITTRPGFSLDEARNYYTVLSSCAAAFGLILGFAYYIHKLRVDKTGAEQERKRRRIDHLIKELETYDDLVDEILGFRISSVADLERTRSKISRSYETITTMLTHRTKLLGFSDEDAQTILRVHSFVEQNSLLMLADLQDLRREELSSVKNAYVDLIQEARKICYDKVC